MPVGELSLEVLASHATSLITHDSLHAYASEHRLASVLVLVYPGEDDLEVILTRRTQHLPTHAGQISLPGGSIEEGDKDHIHTALREAEEEIGLDGNQVEILGSLDVAVLPSGFAVVPVLGLSRTRPVLVPNPEEVAEIFSVPLALVGDPGNYREDAYVREGRERRFYYLEYGDYYIWGATAGILRMLAQWIRAVDQP